MRNLKTKNLKFQKQKTKSVIAQIILVETSNKTYKENKKNLYNCRREHGLEQKVEGFTLATEVNIVDTNNSNKKRNRLDRELSQMTY